MSKILFSWEAFNNDYLERKGDLSVINTKGTTYSFYQHFFNRNTSDKKYTKHYILYRDTSASDGERLNKLKGALLHFREDLDRDTIETVPVKLESPIDIEEIRKSVRAFIEANTDESDEMVFFTSPGTPSMAFAWYLLHFEYTKNRTSLIQTVPSDKAKDKRPQLIPTEFDITTVPNTLIKREKIGNKKILDLEGDSIYRSKSLEKVYDDARKVANTNKVNTIILGASGTGKEHLAGYIHKQSAREKEKFKTINCSAYSDELLRSELFGYVKGAFTGADKDKPGVFEDIDRGTLFLDEIGDISPYMQQSLLRVLQNGEIQPVGSLQVKKVDVRIIAATHQELTELCEKGKFRWDLYFRLSTAVLRIPTLEARGPKEKKEYLDFMIERTAKEFKKEQLKISKDVRAQLLNYDYPGNLREMQNIISTLYVFHEDGIVDNTHYLPFINSENDLTPNDLKEAMAPFEKKHIINVLIQNKFHIENTAKDLGESKATLYKQIDELKIDIKELKEK